MREILSSRPISQTNAKGHKDLILANKRAVKTKKEDSSLEVLQQRRIMSPPAIQIANFKELFQPDTNREFQRVFSNQR